MSLKRFWRALLYWPVRWLTRFEFILDESAQQLAGGDHVVYVLRSTSLTDQLVAERAIREAGLPELQSELWINGQQYARVMYLDKTAQDSASHALVVFETLIAALQAVPQLNVLVVPIGIFLGRKTGQEAREGRSMVADIDSPVRWPKCWL